MILKPTLSAIWAASQSRGTTTQRPHLWQGLMGAWTCHEGQGTRLYDISGYRRHTDSDTIDNDWVSTPYGPAVDFEAAGNINLDTGYSPDGTIQSAVCLVSFGSFGVNQQIFGVHDRSDHRLYLGLDTADDIVCGWGDTYIGFTVASPDWPYAADVWAVYGFRRDAGGTVHVYIDGTEYDSMSASFSGTSSQSAHIGSRVAGNGAIEHPFNGNLATLYWWDRDITETGMQHLAHDPFLLMRPRPFQVPVLTSVSGGTTVEVADSGSGSESLGISATLSVSDTGQGSDTPGIVVALTVTDTGDGSDAITVLKDIIKTVTDTGQGSDSLSNITVTTSVADTGQGTEVQNISAVLTVTDSGSAVDVITAIQEAFITVADTGQGADTISSIQAQIQVVDSGTATDIIEQIQAVLSVADTGTGVETIINYRSGVQIVDITFVLKKRSMEFTLTRRNMKFALSKRSMEFELTGGQ